MYLPLRKALFGFWSVGRMPKQDEETDPALLMLLLLSGEYWPFAVVQGPGHTAGCRSASAMESIGPINYRFMSNDIMPTDIQGVSRWVNHV